MFPARLTQALPGLLNSGGPTIVKLAGDASNRSYFRVTAGGKISVAMLLAETGPNSLAEEITKTHRKIAKLPFIDIQEYLLGKGVKVPKLLGYDEANGVLLLEDLGDDLLLGAVKTADMAKTRALYEKALDELERLAVIPKEGKRDSIAFARGFDKDLYNWEFMHFVECALDKRLKKKPSSADREKIVSGLLALTDEYLAWENALCHRDYHSRNLLVLNGGKEIGVIDFQDALLAPPFYDLASLLRDSYIALDEKLQDDLVERYRAQIAPHLKKTWSRDEFRWAFDLMGTHRNLKAAGRFCYIDQVKGNPAYLADIPRTLDYVKKTVERYPELRALKNALLPYLDAVSDSCR